jgi:uncharacterized protein (TIGR03083 family)
MTDTRPLTRLEDPPTTAHLDHDEGMVLARAAYQRFADAVTDLPQDAWALPTDCSLWTVRDLTGHMVGAMRSAARFTDLLRQQVEVGRRAKRSGADPTDVMTELQVEQTRDLTVDELVAECQDLVERATTGRRRVPAVTRRLVRFPVQVGGVTESWTLGYLYDVVLTRDAWMHAVDVCRAVGRDPVLTPDVDGRIVADVVDEWARRHRRPFRLHLGGPAGGEFAHAPDGDEPPEPLELDAVEFCRILSGRAAGDGLLAVEVPF